MFANIVVFTAAFVFKVSVVFIGSVVFTIVVVFTKKDCVRSGFIYSIFCVSRRYCCVYSGCFIYTG